MSARGILGPSFTFAFALTIAGSAFARQPPALVRAQTAADYAAACDTSNLHETAGYRDAFHRSPADATSSSVPGAGYRAAFARTGVPSEARVACVSAPRLTASR